MATTADAAAHAADIWDKAEQFRVGMLTTRAAAERLASRPMTIQKIEFSPNAVWFFTSKGGQLAAEIGDGGPANLSIADQSDSFYLSISGRAHLVDDRAKAEELWNTLVKAWFPDGLDDPNLALIRLDVESAEYWDSDHSKMVQLLMMAKAAVTGNPPIDIGTHGSLEPSAA